MEPIITSNPKIMHGAPCFAGTRVTVQTFFDHLEAGYTLAGFLEQLVSHGSPGASHAAAGGAETGREPRGRDDTIVKVPS